MISEEETEKYLTEVLEILKEKFESGNKSVVLYATYHCCLTKRPMPEWLRLAFKNAYEAATGYEIKSWDEVFGRPVPKGTHLKTEKRNAALRFLVIKRVQALKTEKPIDKGLFEEIGKELGISGTIASDIYYDERGRELREMLHSLDNSENL